MLVDFNKQMMHCSFQVATGTGAARFQRFRRYENSILSSLQSTKNFLDPFKIHRKKNFDLQSAAIAPLHGRHIFANMQAWRPTRASRYSAVTLVSCLTLSNETSQTDLPNSFSRC